MNQRIKKCLALLCFPALMAFSAPGAAQISFSATPFGDTVASGAVGKPGIDFALGSGYSLADFLFTMDYNPAELQFNLAQSTVRNGASTTSLQEFLNSIGAVSNNNLTGGFFTTSVGLITPFKPLANSVTFTTAFDVVGVAPGGSATVIYGGSFGEATSLSGDLIDTSATISVMAAVPEPEGWLLLLAGGALVAGAARRRRRLPEPGIPA